MHEHLNDNDKILYTKLIRTGLLILVADFSFSYDMNSAFTILCFVSYVSRHHYTQQPYFSLRLCYLYIILSIVPYINVDTNVDRIMKQEGGECGDGELADGRADSRS